MKKFISILLVLVMLFSACSNAFADSNLDEDDVTTQILQYYTDNEVTIMAALKTAAGEYAGMLDNPSFDIKASLAGFLEISIGGICEFMEDICASNASKEEKTSKIAEYLADTLVKFFNYMVPSWNIGTALAPNIQSFAEDYAKTIVTDFAQQLNLATLVSDNPMFFFVFSLVELVAIIGLAIALGKRKNSVK